MKNVMVILFGTMTISELPFWMQTNLLGSTYVHHRDVPSKYSMMGATRNTHFAAAVVEDQTDISMRSDVYRK